MGFKKQKKKIISHLQKKRPKKNKTCRTKLKKKMQRDQNLQVGVHYAKIIVGRKLLINCATYPDEKGEYDVLKHCVGVVIANNTIVVPYKSEDETQTNVFRTSSMFLGQLRSSDGRLCRFGQSAVRKNLQYSNTVLKEDELNTTLQPCAQGLHAFISDAAFLRSRHHWLVNIVSEKDRADYAKLFLQQQWEERKMTMEMN
jgi:hypothetical protein